MKNIQILILILSLISKLSYGQTGTIGNPFITLDQAALVPSDGIYYFDIGGTLFSTYVESGNGWILIASGKASTTESSYATTFALTLQSDSILPSIIYTSTSIIAVRINSTSGPGLPFDVQSSNATVLSNLQNNTTLSIGTNMGDWTGTGTAELDRVCLSNTGSLSTHIYHACGNYTGLHWQVGQFTDHEKVIYNNGTKNDLNLWIKAGCQFPSINFGNDTSLCQGAVLTLDATNSNASYLWQDNSTNPTFTVTQSGTYWVQVTDTCGTSTDTLNVTYNPIPTVDLGNDTNMCQGQTLILDATFAGATYLWQNNSTAPTFNVTSQDMYSVSVSLGSCSAGDTINVNYSPLPTVNLGNDTVMCQGQTLLLEGTTAGVTYLWQDNSTNPTLLATQAGTYWVQITDSCGTMTDSINVSYNPIPTMGLGNDTALCPGETVTLDVTTAGVSYLWQDNSTNPTFIVTLQGIYWVQVSNNCGIISDTIVVNYNPLPSIDLGNDTALCQGEILTLDVTTPNASYLWQDNSTNPTYNATQQGTYWVTVTVNNCSSSDTINVNFNPIPNTDLGNDTTLCQGEILTLDVTTPNASYLWQDNSTNPTYNATQQGTYWVNLSKNNCKASDTINVSYKPNPNVIVSKDTNICLGSTIVLNASGGGTYVWSPSTDLSDPFVSNPLAFPSITTIYTVNVETNGCLSSDLVIIEVDPACTIFVPDIFSPNGDGNNDVVYIQGKGIKEIHFAVFDRWGIKIFETHDISEGWDGSFKGKKLNPAVFVYYLEAVFIGGKEITAKGDITLIR